MGTSEDVKSMLEEGRSEQEIIMNLQSKGVPLNEIQESLMQTRIKEAVTGNAEDTKMTKTAFQNQQMEPSMLASQTQSAPNPNDYSAMSPEPSAETQEYSENQGYENYPPQEYAQQEMQNETPQAYNPYSTGGISTDTINEIVEQIVAEKLAPIKTKLEEALDLKNISESRIASLNERLTRIEKIIDRLQLSVLQKVGDFMTNVEDIKNEITESQKSFKYLLGNSSSKPVKSFNQESPSLE